MHFVFGEIDQRTCVKLSWKCKKSPKPIFYSHTRKAIIENVNCYEGWHQTSACMGESLDEGTVTKTTAAAEAAVSLAAASTVSL